MRITLRLIGLSACAALLAGAFGPTRARAEGPAAFEFKDGDRVAFVGNTFVERSQTDGYLETLLAARFPDRNLTFRNLGWSGDTVLGEARALFGPPQEGFNRLTKLVAEIKPTVFFVCYGLSESFEGPARVGEFAQGYNRMLDMLLANGGPGARLVLVSPIRHEDLGRPLPDPVEHNKSLRLYADAAADVARRRNCRFIDLYALLGDNANGSRRNALTDDGIHLTPYGYWRASLAIESALGFGPRAWRVELDARSPQGKAEGTKLSGVSTSGGGLQFTAADEMLPAPPPPGRAAADADGPGRVVRVAGLSGGRYALKADGALLASGTPQEWAKGVRINGGPAEDRVQKLRELIVAKNFDFFNRWRPANDTYIFGFRKHEQGRNAVEIPQFDQIVADKEAQIAKLRQPAAVTYTLQKE